ncbi:MAG: hypothetical protein JWN75_1127, partial [Candidatus Saccharibacteria bacterium]|nr:hypothetical protein [Candidatus Saccharibacteria bacterium]
RLKVNYCLRCNLLLYWVVTVGVQPLPDKSGAVVIKPVARMAETRASLRIPRTVPIKQSGIAQ